MRFNWLQVTNLGSIKSRRFDFNDAAFVLFTGRNGQGKSTAYDAMLLLLGINVPSTLEDLINWEANFFEIEGEFEHAGHTYHERYYYDGNSRRELTIDGDATKTLTTPTAVTDYLKQVIDPRRFEASALARQGDVDVITVRPAERRDYLMKVHNLSFTRPIESLNQKLQTALETLGTQRGRADTLRQKTYTPADLLRPLFGEAGREKREMERSDLLKSLGAVEAAERARSDLQARRDGGAQVINDMRSQLERAKVTLVENRARRDSFDQTRADEVVRLTIESTAVIVGLEERVTQLETESTREYVPKVGVNPDALTSLDTHKTMLIQTQGELTRCEADIALHESGLCPTCKRPFEGDHSDLTARRDNLVKLVGDLRSLLPSLEQAAQLLQQDQNDRRNHLVRANQALTQLEEARANLQRGREKRNADELRLNESLEQQRSVLDQLIAQTEQTVAQQEAQLLQSQASLTELERQLAEQPVPVTAEFLQQQRDRVVTLQAELDEYRRVLTVNEQALETNARLAQEQLEDEQTLKVLTDEIAAYQRTCSDLEAALKLLKRDFPSYVVSRLLQEVVSVMNTFIELTYEGRYTVTLKESSTGIKILYGPKEKDVSRASGYEQQVFSSAFRNAKEQLTGYGFAMLDEADSAADDVNSLQFYTTMAEMNYTQLFAISHRESVKELLEKDYNALVFEF